MAYLETNGKRLHYEVTGEGDPLLLIHSALMNLTMWDEQVKAFSPHFRVIRCDLYGYGQSAFTEQLQINHGADLEALLNHLQIARANVLGASMGGEVALDFALNYPERVNKLMLVGSGVEGYDYPEDAMAWWGAFIGHIQAQDFDAAIETFLDGAIEGRTTRMPADLRAKLKATMQSYSFRHYFDGSLQWKSQPAAAPRLGELKCSTLVMVGEDDGQVILDIADYLVKHISKATKSVIPKAAHLPNLQNPAAFDQAVLAFLHS